MGDPEKLNNQLRVDFDEASAAIEGPADEVLYVSPARVRGWWALVAGALIVLGVLVPDRGDVERSKADGSRVPPGLPATTAGSVVGAARPSSVQSAEPPFGPSRALSRYPQDPMERALTQLCRNVPTCRKGISRTSVRRAAARALGRMRDLQVHVVSGGGFVVSALRGDGAQLMVVVSRQNTMFNPTALGIAGPIGVQTQLNKHSRLFVIVSGALSSVDLLSLPSVQYWLGTLSADV